MNLASKAVAKFRLTRRARGVRYSLPTILLFGLSFGLLSSLLFGLLAGNFAGAISRTANASLREVDISDSAKLARASLAHLESAAQAQVRSVGVTATGGAAEIFPSAAEANLATKVRNRLADKEILPDSQTPARTQLGDSWPHSMSRSVLPHSVLLHSDVVSRDVVSRDVASRDLPLGDLLGRDALISDSLKNWFGISQQSSASSLMSGLRGDARLQLPDAVRGRRYCESFGESLLRQLAQVEVTAQIITVRLVEGALPTGLQLQDDTLRICGTAAETGAFDFTLQLTVAGKALRGLFRLAVLDGTTNSAEGELRVLSKSLPVALVGRRYGAKVEVAGGRLPYRFNVTGLPAGFEIDGRSGAISGTASVESTGEITVQISDANQSTITKSFTFTVRTAPLSITTDRIPTAKVGEQMAFRFAAEGGALPYSWQLLRGALPRGLQFDATLGEIRGAAQQEGVTTLRAQVSDPRGHSDAVELKLTIRAGQLEITSRSLPRAIIGERYLAKVDSRGGRPPYVWRVLGPLPEGFSLSSDGLLTGEPQSEWMSTVSFQVSDALGAKATRELALRSGIKGLQLETATLAEATACTDYSFPLRVVGGRPPYQFSLQGNSSLNIDGNGVLSGRPEKDEFLSVRVVDSGGEQVERRYELVLTNAAPELASSADIRCEFGISCEALFQAKGGCGPYTFSTAPQALPTGLSLRGSGEMSGLPSAVGDYTFLLTIIDSLQTRAEQPIAVNVSAAPLAIVSSSLGAARVGGDYRATLEARGGEPPYIWGAEGAGLPEGLLLDSRTGEILGRPINSGSSDISLRVADTRGRTATSTMLLTIEPSELRIDGASTAETTVGEELAVPLQAVGGLPPYTWRVSAANVPAQVASSPPQFDGGVGQLATLRVNPTELQLATVTVEVSDARMTIATHSVDVVVNPAALQIVTTSPLPEGRLSQPYRTAFAVSGGRPPYQFQLAAGMLPAGLQLNATTGELLGEPLEEVSAAAFIVSVRDVDAQSAQALFELSVTGDGRGFVTQLVARAGNGKVGLLWRNPIDPDFLGVRILRKQNSFSQNGDDGTIVYSGRESIALDGDAANQSEWFYSAFAIYADGATIPPGESGRATAQPGEHSPFADSVVSFSPLSPDCFGCDRMPSVVLGPPQGGGEFGGSTDVVSLGARVNSDGGGSAPYGGSITLAFDDNIIVDGPGVDFTVFENVFRAGQSSRFWLEPATVEVSADGIRFYRFSLDYVPHFDEHGREDPNIQSAFARGFAGINPVFANGSNPSPTDPNVSGGDSFDLAQLEGVRLPWVRFVRITSTGEAWLRDRDGELVRHSNEAPTFSASGSGNSGFDLDAVAAVNY